MPMTWRAISGRPTGVARHSGGVGEAARPAAVEYRYHLRQVPPRTLKGPPVSPKLHHDEHGQARRPHREWPGA